MAKLIYRPQYATGKLIAESMGIDAITKNDGILEDEKIIRWGTTATINRPVGVKASVVVNKAPAIKEAYDKVKFRKLLGDLAPPTWYKLEDWLCGDIDTTDPVIVRPASHHAGSGFYFCESPTAVAKSIQSINGPYYISKFIDKTVEYRVFVVSGRIAAAVRKVPADINAPYWGCTEGADKFKYINWSEWSIPLVSHAVASFNVGSLDFGAFDIIEEYGKFYTLEANTAPEMTPYYAKTLGKCFKYILDNGNDRLPVEGSSWKNYIHPAIYS